MEVKKRVLLVAKHPVGGIKTFFRYIYGSQYFDNFELTFITPDSEFEAYADEFIPNTKVITVDKGGALNFILAVRALIATKEFDLVHSHGFTAGVLTQISKFKYPTTHLMTAHDVFTVEQFNGIKGAAKHIIMSKVFNKIDFIHTVTKDAELNFLSFFPKIAADKIESIVHGVDTIAFKDSTRRDLKAELNLDQNTILFGFLGRFMAQKGFRTIVKAIAILKSEGFSSTDLKVCTFGWGGFIREDFDYLNELGLGEYFIQLPETNNVASGIKGLDCVLMPSRWEACGLLAMEVLAAGKPLIATNCVGLREITKDTPTITTEVNDEVSLSKNIKSFADNIDSQTGRFLLYQQAAVDRYSIERPRKAISQLYSAIVKE